MGAIEPPPFFAQAAVVHPLQLLKLGSNSVSRGDADALGIRIFPATNAG
jgi:hypothetical protein